MAKKFPLSIVIGAVDRASGPVARATSKIDRALVRMSLPMLKLQRSMGNLARSSGLDKVGMSLKNSAHQARAFGSALGGALTKLGLMAGAALALGGALLHSFAKAGETALMTAKKLGIGVEWLQEWEYAARQAGLEGETFSNGLKFLSKQVGEAAAGQGASVAAFNALGIAVKTAEGNTRDLPDVLDETIQKLGALEDANLRNALAARIFGRSAGIEMVPLLEQGAEETDRLRARARDLGIVLSEDMAKAGDDYMDTLDELKSAAGGARNAFLGAALPVITQQLQRLTAWIVTNRGKIAEWGQILAEKIPAALKKTREGLTAVWKATEPLRNVLQSLADRFGGANVAAVALGLVLFGPALVSALTLTKALFSLTASIVKVGITMATTQIGGMSFIGFLKLMSIGCWSAMKAVWALTAALLANPFVLLIVGITAVIAAIVIFKDEIWTFLKDAGGWIWTKMQQIGGWLIAPFQGAWEFLTGWVKKVPAAIGAVFDWIGAKFKWLTSWLPDWVEKKLGIGGDVQVQIGDQEISPVVAGAGGVTRQEAHVILDINGLPKGSRTREVSNSGVPVNMTLGYSNYTQG